MGSYVLPVIYLIVMGIQHDIKQSKFRNEYQKSMVNIIYTASWITEKLREIFSKYNLTHQQYNVLRILRGSHPQPLSTREIRNRMLDKMSDASRIVDRLIAKGLASKRVCKSNKRLVDVTITEKGKLLLHEMDAHADEMDSIMHHISEAEARALNRILDKIRGG